MVQDATSRLRRSRPHFDKCERSMIRPLHGHEAADSSRATKHPESFDLAADQEAADEFRELLERAHGRVSSASDEVSALSLALAQTQVVAQMRPQPIPERRDPPPASKEETCEPEALEGGDEQRDTACSQGSYVGEKEASSAERESATATVEDDSDAGGAGETTQVPVDAPETQEIVDSVEVTGGAAVETVGDKDEPTTEKSALQDEITNRSVVSQPQGDGIGSKALSEPTKEPLKVEVKAEAVPSEGAPAVRQVSPNLTEEGADVSSDVASGHDQPGQAQPLQWKPTVETRAVDTAASPLKGSSVNPNGELSIQMAMLRQAFEGVKGFGSPQREGASKQEFYPSQTVGAAGESRGARGDLQGKASKPMTRPQVQRMLERVETAMKEAARTRDGKTIRFRVEPFNLGEVKVDVSLREGGLHARLKAENQNVAMVLREKAHELQGALRKLGLDVDNVTVTVSEDEDAQYAAGQQNLSDGKSFQEERNNMPSQVVQVVETTVGNELAEVSPLGPSKVTDAILDHWVA
jgi:flagellar hook-length control protein FliK